MISAVADSNLKVRSPLFRQDAKWAPARSLCLVENGNRTVENWSG